MTNNVSKRSLLVDDNLKVPQSGINAFRPIPKDIRIGTPNLTFKHKALMGKDKSQK